MKCENQRDWEMEDATCRIISISYEEKAESCFCLICGLLFRVLLAPGQNMACRAERKVCRIGNSIV